MFYRSLVFFSCISFGSTLFAVTIGSKNFTENTPLGKFTLKNIRPTKRGEVKLEVNFSINADGLVNVAAKDLESGQAQSVQLQVSGTLAEEEVQQLMQKQAV